MAKSFLIPETPSPAVYKVQFEQMDFSRPIPNVKVGKGSFGTAGTAGTTIQQGASEVEFDVGQESFFLPVAGTMPVESAKKNTSQQKRDKDSNNEDYRRTLNHLYSPHLREPLAAPLKEGLLEQIIEVTEQEQVGE